MRLAISIIAGIVIAGILYAQRRWARELRLLDLSHSKQQKRAKSHFKVYYRGRRKW